MLREKLKSLSGFTVVELLVVIGSLSLILFASTSFLMTSLSSSGKAEALKEVRQNGESAINAIRSLLVTSNSVSGCIPDDPLDFSSYKSLTFVSRNNDVEIECVTGTDAYLASNSARLTDSGVQIHKNPDNTYACYLYCLQPPGGSAVVKIKFTLDLANQSSLPSKEQISQTFETSISLLGI